MDEGIKVIYVDDEPDLLEIARIFLEEEGTFRVTTATSAAGMLESSRIPSYDLILSDYQMPGMDGIAFLKEIRSRYGDIPFILFTGRGREEVVIEAINNGADFYIQKGGDPTAQFAELAHKIRLAVERRRTAQALLESEEKYRSLVDLAPLAVVVCRGEKIVYANPESVRIYGTKDAGGLAGRAILPLIHPDDRRSAQEYLQQLQSGITIPLTEIRFLNADGNPFTVEAAGKMIVYGGHPSMIIVYRDVTDRKRQEDELKAAYEQIAAADEELRSQYEELASSHQKLWESRQQISDIADTVPGVVYQFFIYADGSMKAAYMSTRAGELFGLRNEKERLFERFTEQVDPRDRDAFMDSIRVAAASVSPWNFEGRYIRPDGRTIWFQGISQPVKKGSMLVFNGILLDITTQKMTEESIRDNELRFRTIFEKTHDAFLIVSDGKFSDCNQSAVDMFGYSSKEEITGMRPGDLSPVLQPDGQDSASAAEEHTRTALERGTDHFIWAHRKKDGSTFVADVLLSAYELAGRRIIFSSVRDITARQKMEEELFSSQQMLLAVLDCIPQRVFWKDRNSVFLGCNRPLALDVGYADPLGIVGKTDDDHSSRAIAEHFRADDREVMESGRPKLNFEEPQIRPDGSTAWLRTSKVPLRNRAGSIIGVLGTYEDITSEKLAGEKLRESEENYRLLVEKANEAIIIVQDQRFVFANNRTAELLGRPADSLIGTPVMEHIWPDDRRLIANRHVMRLAGEEPPNGYDFRIIDADGKPVWVYLSSAKIMWQGKPATLNLMTDITKRKLAEESLRESEAKFRHIIENMQDAYIRADETGVITMVNPSAARMFGYDSAGEMAGVHANTLYLRREDRTELLRLLRDAGGITNFSGKTVRRDGTIFPVSMNVQILRDESGRVTGTEAIVREVS